uniref:uncharacterized protein LOC122604453 n=1 Tax=Erigeron canadensis TaxID=72917 RepID=UPI001CB8A5CD|nr:uncharacterized protein LOC122604453 [Erigeron canadensis]
MSSSSSSTSFDSFGSEDYDDVVESAVVGAVTLAMRVAQEEEEEEEEERSRFTRRVVLVHRRAEAQENLMRDYFVDQPTYTTRQFRRRFRMHKGLFLKIVGDMEREYRYLQQRVNVAGKLGFTALQKCTAAIRQLAYGVTSDLLDEYLQMTERTSREVLGHFCSGSYNDINVFQSSPVLEDLVSGLAPSGDGIYPEYATFVKTFTDPIDEKRKFFKKKQESACKGIERAFGVLKKRWKVLNHPAQYWDKELMQDVIYACIILHNMIFEDEDKAKCQDYNPDEPSLVPGYWEQMTPLKQRIQNRHVIKSRETHNMLTADLVDHLWSTQAHDFDADNEDLPDLNEYVSSDDE